MEFIHRKLVGEPSLCKSVCAKDGPINCPTPCSISCPNKCISSYDPYKIIPPSSPVSPSQNSHKNSMFLTVTIVLVAASFLLICGYGFYMKYYNNSRSRNSSSPPDHHQTHDDAFLDEEHRPTVDHPIWHIRTIGLQPSTINSITVLKYKRGDGIVDGTDCSVCLSEFQEDESLRLLPKCSHAFHIPCIDTWLRSHTNCPMCRAPIVINSVIRTSLPEPSNVNSSLEEETRMGVSENESQNDTEIGRDHADGKRGQSSSDEDVMERTSRSSRRSFSSSGFSTSPALLPSKERYGSFSDKQLELVNKLNSAVGGNQKLRRISSGSSNERSLQSGPVSMKRSVSCNGKFVLCSQVKSSSHSILPLRSI